MWGSPERKNNKIRTRDRLNKKFKKFGVRSTREKSNHPRHWHTKKTHKTSMAGYQHHNGEVKHESDKLTFRIDDTGT